MKIITTTLNWSLNTKDTTNTNKLIVLLGIAQLSTVLGTQMATICFKKVT